MKGHLLVAILMITAALLVVSVIPATAHQPFFEEEDIQAGAPWQVEDPSISTAVYATLESAQDVDYFKFEGQAGQRVLLSLVIPQIEGQAQFAPDLALLGPGLEDAQPSGLGRPAGLTADSGALRLPPPEGEASTFFEPFSRTSYWERQEQYVTLPEDGTYVAAVWDTDGELGRYTFVIGDKEVMGGDMAFPVKMRQYWTPVQADESGLTAPTCRLSLFNWCLLPE